MAVAGGRTVGAFVAALVLVLCGCGGDDGSRPPGGPRVVGQPTPKQPIGAQMAAFNRVVATRRCAIYLPLVHSFNGGRPAGSPVTRADCKPGSFEFGPLRGNRFCCARQYGT